MNSVTLVGVEILYIPVEGVWLRERRKQVNQDVTRKKWVVSLEVITP